MFVDDLRKQKHEQAKALRPLAPGPDDRVHFTELDCPVRGFFTTPTARAPDASRQERDDECRSRSCRRVCCAAPSASDLAEARPAAQNRSRSNRQRCPTPPVRCWGRRLSLASLPEGVRGAHGGL